MSALAWKPGAPRTLLSHFKVTKPQPGVNASWQIGVGKSQVPERQSHGHWWFAQLTAGDAKKAPPESGGAASVPKSHVTQAACKQSSAASAGRSSRMHGGYLPATSQAAYLRKSEADPCPHSGSYARDDLPPWRRECDRRKSIYARALATDPMLIPAIRPSCLISQAVRCFTDALQAALDGVTRAGRLAQSARAIEAGVRADALDIFQNVSQTVGRINA